jgi:signal transduction histidine kinase
MLSGINENWINNGNINFASYTNLPPGNYKFMVRASNSDRVWNKEPFEISVIIDPPYWQTWWFFLLVVVFAVSALFFIHGQRVKSEINKALEIKKAREQENLKVRKKAADDFHDELGHRLTKISLYSEIIKRNTKDLPPNLMNYLDKIGETSSTLSFGVRDFIWTLDPEKDTLYDVLIRLKDFGDDIFDKTGIAFRVHGIEKEFETIKLSMDWRRHLTLIFKEAMNNILKYANCTNVTLYVEFNDGKIHMSVEDDGKGFNFEKIKKGRGLRSMKMRAQNINGNISVNSNNGQGTVVEFYGALA